ncbi:hypothetical protein V1512DRAFT_264433 [Lipomyces arxii]|uniref:uncharacterized protein n=1 Tax=Lipomyces arxii TaxID=56418 RepID=UPI0034CFA204
MADKSNGRVVFVGNIPYDQSEEQIMDLFQSVGPVINFRFVFDKDTGRSKGFGFVEYRDAETAASAVRNLNNYELSNRTLRVDFSHESFLGSNSDKEDTLLPQLPRGTNPPPHLSTADVISETLSAFTPIQMLSILQELKTIVATNPAKASELLRAAPQLSYAVVQAMLLMGLVDPTSIAKAFDPSAQRSTDAPPLASSAPVAANPPAGIPSDKATLIRQVMELTEEQLASLPPTQRVPIEELRNKIRRGEF